SGADPTTGCDGSCASVSTFLSVADVERVIAQGVAEAQGLGAQATIAVVDRVGNVLAVYRMGAAANRVVVIASGLNANGTTTVSGGLEGLRLPVASVPVSIDDQAAISKAITGAYLSTEGNAFSTRTASQIIQEHFAPNEAFQAGGPLFGVQFSQLACSDLMRSYDGMLPSVGPQRSPLGLSADPGGFPLYKNGTVVGAVGVISDGIYGLDKVITNNDRDTDEMIAFAATFGYAAPVDRRADRITADGRTLRFSDVEFPDLTRNPANATPFASLGGAGALVATTGYSSGTIVAGTAFGQPTSGIRLDTSGNYSGQDAFVLVDAANAQRFPPQASAVVGSLTALEVQNLMSNLMGYANATRAQIRRPLGSPARVTASIVDTSGAILAIARSRDAPVFGIDVSLQKARTAALLSSNTASTFLTALPNAKYPQLTDASATVVRQIAIGDYVTAARSFVGSATALGDGAIAYSARAVGNLSRPFYPDGIDGSPAGPLSKAAGEWSVFSTGLQLDIAQNAILQHVLHTAGAPLPDVAVGCAGVDLANDFSSATQTVSNLRLANGLQIFPGGVPIYRSGVLIGAVGVSGDGVDQDDMIAFLGANRGADNAPLQMRADTLTPQGVRLRYVQCPQAPFLRDGVEEGVCQGK
ncbi:MAG TPA: heme-binding protein, partial [Steroidobacteraceae bacterium]|nr:heme-binding protein [Steroidobacteraceae bacterium]